MYRVNRLSVQTFLLICIIGHGFGQRDKYLGGLIDFLNNLPNQLYVYEDGLLLSSHNAGENTYKLEVSLKASDVQDPKSFKLLKCTATIQDNGEAGITVQENEHQCHEDIVQPPATDAGTGGGEEVAEDTANTDAPLQEVPVRLDNEVQSDTAVTSGEQFVAIPRHLPNTPCIGCSSQVNPEAPGVRDLALLGLRHLDRHEPTVRHNLKGILEVERQVQVVNGVRYILTINVDYENCTISETDGCSGNRTCKISILEKPWVKLPDGSKFRAILANNCTENWLFGDDGEVLPPAGDKSRGNVNINSINDGGKHVGGSDDDFFKVIYQTDTQAKPPTERTLSEDDLKLLEEQIIPNNENPTTEAPVIDIKTEPNVVTNEENVVQKEANVVQKEESAALNQNFVQKEEIEVQKEAANNDINAQKELTTTGTGNTLSDQKKKDIDDLFSFINYAGLESNPSEEEHNPRMRRSYNDDLKVVKLADMFKNINRQVADGTTVDGKQKYVIQKRLRRNNGLVGGAMDQDPNDPKYIELANNSFNKYVQQSGSTGKVTRVLHVTTQVVAGLKTVIDFEIMQNGSVMLICTATVLEQSWLNNTDIDVHCEKQTDRQKRETEKGGKKEKDPKDPLYQKLAQESLEQHTTQKGLAGVWNVAEVTKVTYQVVAGSLTEIDFKSIENGGRVLSCHSEVWERPWLNKKDIQVDCKEGVRRKRQLPGGETGQNPKDPQYQKLAQESLKQHVTQKGLAGVWNVAEVTTVTTQVVAGTMTKIDFKSIENGGRVLSCHSEVWEQSWLKKKDIQVDCKEGLRSKRQLLGGKEEKDPKDPMYQNLAQESLKQHVTQKGLAGVWNVAEVTKVTYQVVSGSSTEIDFKCVENGGQILYCHSKVWEQSWLKKKEIQVDCEESGRRKRSVSSRIGGQTEKNPKDPTYRKLAQESLKKHVSQKGLAGVWNVAEVTKVTYQVVSGSVTKVDFNSIENGGQVLSCHSKVWEQPWLKIKEIEVECHDVGLKPDAQQENDQRKLANEALTKYDKDSNSKYSHKVLKLLHVYPYNVSALVNVIDFTMAPTKCLRADDDMVKPSCEVDTSKKLFICHAVIEEKNKDKRIITQCMEKKVPEIHKKQPFDHVKNSNVTSIDTEFENQQLTTSLGDEALKHIEFKYPHPQRQKVVRIFSVDKQTIAGLHYRLKLEVGFTDCLALSVSDQCNLVKNKGDNRFCRANIWLRPWTEHPPIVRVVCDNQEAATAEVYHQVQVEHLFYDFLTTHRPSYMDDPVEMRQRFQIFKANVRKIHELNTRERGTARYAVTQFSDLSYEEFFRKYLGLDPKLRDPNQIPRAPARIPELEIPDGFDWREHGAVTDVKNQGSCGSCWAFSVTGNIEGQYKLQTGKLLSLSEQELVDCDRLDQGCNGGMPDNAYRSIEAMGGLETEDEYPYEGEADKCAFNKTLVRVRLSGAVNISSNETDMAKWLLQNGPISIGINANAMQFYVGGVSHPWKMLCNPNNIDHGVLIVGYGVKNYPLFHKTMPYWIVKNSWGPSWGEQGYYRVYRGDGTCGVNTLASSAILTPPAPTR